MKHPPSATDWSSLAPGGQWFPALVLMAVTAAILLCLSLWGPTPQPVLAPAPTPELTASPVGDSPADLPLGEALLDPDKSADFGAERKAARAYLEEALRHQGPDGPHDSSAYSIRSLTPVDGFTDPARPAEVFLLTVGLGDSEETFERYLLFDGSGDFLGARSPQEFTLYHDGYPLRLGTGDLWLFGTPSGHNTIPGGDDYSMYSEWFSPDNNSCGYNYYYEIDEYRLYAINTIQPDVFTSRDIHVGSTVAQVLEAYPELAATTFSTQTSCLTVNEEILGGDGCRLEFYFDTNGGFPESREDTLARPITAISLAAPHW